MAEKNPRKSNGVSAVDRALSILSVFQAGDQALTLAEISKRTRLYKSTILRLLASLTRSKFIRRLPDGRYQIGAEPLRLGQIYQASYSLRDAIMPVLRRLTTKCGVTASFQVLDGEARVCLYRMEPDRLVRVSMREGERAPLDRGAPGKVLRAFSGGPGQGLQLIRKAGYATSFGERDPYIAGIAAPVFGPGQILSGSLNLSGLVEEFTPRNVAKLRAHLLPEASHLTSLLGGNQEIAIQQAAKTGG